MDHHYSTTPSRKGKHLTFEEVRTLRATIPESESHSPAVYSTVLLT